MGPCPLVQKPEASIKRERGLAAGKRLFILFSYRTLFASLVLSTMKKREPGKLGKKRKFDSLGNSILDYDVE